MNINYFTGGNLQSDNGTTPVASGGGELLKLLLRPYARPMADSTLSPQLRYKVTSSGSNTTSIDLQPSETGIGKLFVEDMLKIGTNTYYPAGNYSIGDRSNTLNFNQRYWSNRGEFSFILDGSSTHSTTSSQSIYSVTPGDTWQFGFEMKNTNDDILGNFRDNITVGTSASPEPP